MDENKIVENQEIFVEPESEYKNKYQGKKFKNKKFAAGCSREVIQRGAEMLGWDLDDLIEKTILAMRTCEE